MMQKSFLSSLRPLMLLIVACGCLVQVGCTKPKADPKTTIDPATATRDANADNASAAPASAEGNYTIADRRIMEYYTTQTMPAAEDRITKNCQDAKVKITIDWRSFGNGSEASKNLEALTNSNAINQSVDSIVSALKLVCTDKIGQEAVASKFTRIQVMHQHDVSEPTFKFANGVGILTVNVNESKSPWTQDIQKVLESGL
jgi:hypothetical protein